MKLLYITNGINGAGGLERVLSVKASYLADQYNYEVTIVTLNEEHPNSFYTFSSKVELRSITVDGNPINYAKSYTAGLKNIIKEIQPDVISVCDDGLKGFFIPLLIRSTKIPVIYERHVSKEIEMNVNDAIWKKAMVRAKWKLMDYLGSHFSKFIVLTNGNLNEWKSLRNTAVIANPLSFYPEEFSALDQKKVIAVGKQGYQKGYDLLLKAWANVAHTAPEWKLEIYGKKEPKEKLEELARQLNIEHSVTFYDPIKNIQEKYLEASIYVMSSRFEGFGMVLIEAMACGVPCVSFDCQYGPGDIITDKVDGLLVEVEDPKALTVGLIQLIQNSQQRKEMGTRAKENVKRYLPENIVEQWHLLFKDLAN